MVAMVHDAKKNLAFPISKYKVLVLVSKCHHVVSGNHFFFQQHFICHLKQLGGCSFQKMIGKHLMLVLLTCFFQSSILPTNTLLRLYHAPQVIVDCVLQTFQGTALDYIFNQPWHEAPTTDLVVHISALDYVRALDSWEDDSTDIFKTCFAYAGTEQACLSQVHRLVMATENQLREEHQTSHIATNAIMRVGLEIKLLLDAMVRDLYRARRNGALFLQGLFSNLFILSQCKRLLPSSLTGGAHT